MDAGLDPAVRSKLEPHLASVAHALGVENVLHYYSRATYLSSEDVQNFKEATKDMEGKLAFILRTLGGELQAAVDIIEAMREKFKHVTAIVPVQACSSGALIALACDQIIISEDGILSPTDPQAQVPDLNVHLPLRDVVLAHEEYKAGACDNIAHELIESIHTASKRVYDSGLKAQEQAMLSVPGRGPQDVRDLLAFFCVDRNKPHEMELGYDDIKHLPLQLQHMEASPDLNDAVKQADNVLRIASQHKDVSESEAKFRPFVPFPAPQP